MGVTVRVFLEVLHPIKAGTNESRETIPRLFCEVCGATFLMVNPIKVEWAQEEARSDQRGWREGGAKEDKAKGRMKGAAGAITGDEDKKAEGRA